MQETSAEMVRNWPAFQGTAARILIPELQLFYITCL
jgi:hypothetical protein